jgi:hypothetical protein
LKAKNQCAVKTLQVGIVATGISSCQDTVQFNSSRGRMGRRRSTTVLRMAEVEPMNLVGGKDGAYIVPDPFAFTQPTAVDGNVGAGSSSVSVLQSTSPVVVVCDFPR